MRLIADDISNLISCFSSFPFGTTVELSRLSRCDRIYRVVTYLQDSKNVGRTENPDFLYSTRKEKHYVTSSLFTVAVLVKRLNYIS